MPHWRDTQERPEIAYSADEASDMDSWLTEQRGFSLSQLMNAAGVRLTCAVIELFVTRHLKRVVYMVGPGNNGGDALVARTLAPDEIPGEVWQPLVGERLPDLDDTCLLVDGLFGVGLTRPIAGPAREGVEHVLSSAAYVLAVDVPSGLCATTGAVVGVTPEDPGGGVAVRADRTLAFVGPKQGFFEGAGPAHVGLWRAVEIGFPVEEAESWVRARRTQEV
jgi:NAD(P)H-hydrate repair Nnr-like enzyme with NAD(P)H-hydrate epimerase domain